MRKNVLIIAAIFCFQLLSGCANGGESRSSSPMPTTAEVRTSAPTSEKARETDPMPSNVAKGPISIDETYFSFLGATYDELSTAYGDADIYGNMEWGLYALFEPAYFYCRFDFTIFERNYESLDAWFFDPDEFRESEQYSDRYYIGTRYSASDFVVGYVSVWGKGVNDFFGCEEPVLLSVVNEYFGSANNPGDVVLNEMYEIYESANYDYGKYSMFFEVEPFGDDYIVNIINFWERYAD